MVEMCVRDSEKIKEIILVKCCIVVVQLHLFIENIDLTIRKSSCIPHETKVHKQKDQNCCQKTRTSFEIMKAKFDWSEHFKFLEKTKQVLC